MRHVAEYRDSGLCRDIIGRINALSTKPVRIMEVCGTHTVSIFRNGIRSVLPETIGLISGPGCPVCVTAQGEIDAAVGLARQDNTIVATFGDLIRVPGTDSSLQMEKARGADVRIVYCASDAVEIARQHPGKEVVFLGVGFETTAPTIAAAVLEAARERVDNFSVFAMHKVVPPALAALMETPGVEIDGFLLPGHVSVIIGMRAYSQFFDQYRVPCAVAGFEPVDILHAVLCLTEMLENDDCRLENCYGRVVAENGNPSARQVMDMVFEPCDAQWRGLGAISGSGLQFREVFAGHDAKIRFGLQPEDVPPPAGCACGEILTGKRIPPECRLYKTRCTPVNPVGPCMVSTEGTCAAYYKYHHQDSK